MPRTVYIETTIRGAHCDERDDVVSRFQRYQTRRNTSPVCKIL
jgi:hypothetical protein